MEEKVEKILTSLLERYPKLAICKNDIISTYNMLVESYDSNGKLLIAGNGGSASDAEHIVGELMKTFKIPRKVDQNLADKLIEIHPEYGKYLADSLEVGLAAIPLVSNEGLLTAFINDVGAEAMYAQQVLGYGRKNDVFWGISTSGNSKNIIHAAIVAKALGMKVIGMTGESGGDLLKYSDVIIRVPEKETFIVQELHLPVYHCLCMMLEIHYFGK